MSNFKLRVINGEVGKGIPFERVRRITGYLVGDLSRFNDGKSAEVIERKKHEVNKMKKFITLTITLCLIISAFTVTTNAADNKKKAKYIKVKKATFQTYKKAYSENKKLKKKITQLEKALANKQIDYEDAMDQYELALENCKKLETELASQKSSNQWIWNSVRSMGIYYKNKNWTIPAELPEKFIIDGVTYTVTKEAK